MLYKYFINEVIYTKIAKPGKYGLWYTIIGAGVGILFPVFALLFILFVSSEIYILFIVICTAPFILGTAANFAGRQQDKVKDLTDTLQSHCIFYQKWVLWKSILH